MARICKYGCGTMLEGFDEDKRRYIEYGTTDCLHTVDRCKEAKAKRQEKDDHGNETISGVRKEMNDFVDKSATELKTYIDHTLKGQSKVKIFFGAPPTVEQEYNRFLEDNHGKIKTQGAQFQLDADWEMAIALYYEEIKGG